MNTPVVLIFVDGLGLGQNDPSRNPLARLPGGFLGIYRADGADPPQGRVHAGGLLLGLDAALGVDGLPQSATGQTTLLTGVNAARELGRHLYGFPNQALRSLIMEHSILKQAAERGLKACFLNAYRPRFFEIGEAIWEKPLSVTTWTNRAAGLPFFTLEDVVARASIYQDFSNESLRARGFDVPVFTPEEAGTILARRARDFDFLLYEYFRTDGAGHAQEMEGAVREIERLERFVKSALAGIDLAETLVILTSDHGNIEDLSVKAHTGNPALTILWGRGAEDAAARLETIQDVAAVILDAVST